VPVAWLLMRRATGFSVRVAMALTLGPVLVALGFACRQLGWWSGLDGVLLVLLVAATTTAREPVLSPLAQWVWAGFVGFLLLPGIVHLLPRSETGASNALNPSEVFGLVEIDIVKPRKALDGESRPQRRPFPVHKVTDPAT